MRNKPTAGLAFIFVTMLIDVLGMGLIIPILPKLVTRLSGGETSVGATEFGFLIAVYGLMQFFFAPILGSLSDRFGRRPVLLVSLVFTGIDYVLTALAPSLGWLFVGRILAGITGASLTAASAYIADVSPPEKRAQNFGLIGSAFSLGFILGPALGGQLGGLSDRAPFWAAAALAFLNAAYGFFVLPESLTPENRRTSVSLRTMANPIAGLSILLRFGWVKAMAGSMALLALAFQSLQVTWVLYTTYRFHWTERDNGWSLAVIGVASGFIQIFGIRFAMKRLGERRAIMVGFLFNILGFLGFALATQGWMMYAVSAVWCISGIAGPAIQSLISRDFAPDEQGTVQGALTSLQSLVGIVGPVIAAAVFGYFTAPTTPVQIPGASFFMATILTCFSALLAYQALHRHAQPVALVE